MKNKPIDLKWCTYSNDTHHKCFKNKKIVGCVVELPGKKYLASTYCPMTMKGNTYVCASLNEAKNLVEEDINENKKQI